MVGVLLLLETTGIVDTKEILRFFPSVLIILGIWVLVKNRFRSFFVPLLLVLIGLAWQLVALDHLSTSQVLDFWPVILKILGIYLIIGRYRAETKESNSEYSSAFAVFGDVKKRNTSKNFVGGEMPGIFSDIDLDLRDIEVKERPAV